MIKPEAVEEQLSVSDWGCWRQAEHWSHQEFPIRSPADRLAWLENLLELRRAAISQPNEQHAE